ncbi:hypothetical protein [Pseudoalteromonas maricaloris]|uniref:hypothetical protein n=1 Tax=Pseudoalteromonas maricaloris TaxID=184924 RepID=UPI003C27072A
MLVTKQVAQFDEIDAVGSHIHVLKSHAGTRIIAYKNGTEVINTEVWQGMSVYRIHYDKVQLFTQRQQEVSLWLGDTPFDYKEISTRQQTIVGEQKFIGNGINELLNNDPSRILARVECDKDIWIGGEDLKVTNGFVENARRYKAGQEFEMKAYGRVLCYITDDATAPLLETQTRLGEYDWTYGEVLTRSKLMTANIPYVDIYIPPRMGGVPFSIDAELEAVATPTRASYDPRLFITEGDPSTEQLIKYGWISGGHGMEQGDKKILSTGSEITLSSGIHRVFLVDHGSDSNTGTESWMAFNSLTTDNEVFAIAGTCQLLKELA